MEFGLSFFGAEFLIFTGTHHGIGALPFFFLDSLYLLGLDHHHQGYSSDRERDTRDTPHKHSRGFYSGGFLHQRYHFS